MVIINFHVINHKFIMNKMKIIDMKRYIKPSTDITNVELQQMIAASPNSEVTYNPSDPPVDPGTIDSKGYSLFGDDNVDPTPQTFNVWED